jgi:NAD(P)-dependent dehydrogenase (short-subunit alcohol dehydrogenase family)
MTAAPLLGRTGLVTGCGRPRGLGRGIALELARLGADVAIADRPRPEGSGSRPSPQLELLAAEIEATGRRCQIVIGDVGSGVDAERMVEEAAALGTVEILVNNAAAPRGAESEWTWQVPESAWDLVLRTNATGPFLMSSAVVRRLLAAGADYGRIVNIASAAGLRGLPRRAAYSASKFALIGLTQAMAWELAARHITVNAVCPGTIRTDRYHDRAAQQSAQPESLGIALPAAPVRRVGEVSDVARVVAFLADPAADFITGQAYSVDGGFSLV